MSDGRPAWQRHLLYGLGTILLVDVGVLCLLTAHAMLADYNWLRNEELFIGLVLTMIYLLAALAAVGLLVRGGNAPIMLLAAAMAGVTLALWYVLLAVERSLDHRAEERLLRIIWTLSIIDIALIYDGGVRLYDAKHGPVCIVRTGVIGVGWSFVGLILFTIWIMSDDVAYSYRWQIERVLYPTLTALGLASLFGPIVLRTLHHRETRRYAKDDSILDKDVRLAIDCPGCGEPLELPTGFRRCRACGFTMTIEIEEPRCECGYLIYEHAGANCPECGREIPEEDRWVEQRVAQVARSVGSGQQVEEP